MALTSADIGKTYTFETYNGVRHKHLKFLAILDSDTVASLGVDLPATHAQMYPYLPDGAPTSYQAYTYAKFVDLSGDHKYYIGLPWIRPTSLVEEGSPNYKIIIRNASAEKIQSVRSMLSASGIEDFTIQQI